MPRPPAPLRRRALAGAAKRQDQGLDRGGEQHRFERHVLGRRVVRVPRRPANVAPIDMQHADGVVSEADAVELKRRRGR